MRAIYLLPYLYIINCKFILETFNISDNKFASVIIGNNESTDVSSYNFPDIEHRSVWNPKKLKYFKFYEYIKYY